MTTKQLAKVKELRLEGKTYQSIADEIGCSMHVVRYYLVQLGMVQDGAHARSKLKYPDMVSDWNAGMSSEDMAQKYGYKNIHTLHNVMAWLRAKGMAFDRRWIGSKPKEKARLEA